MDKKLISKIAKKLGQDIMIDYRLRSQAAAISNIEKPIVAEIEDGESRPVDVHVGRREAEMTAIHWRDGLPSEAGWWLAFDRKSTNIEIHLVYSVGNGSELMVERDTAFNDPVTALKDKYIWAGPILEPAK